MSRPCPTCSFWRQLVRTKKNNRTGAIKEQASGMCEKHKTITYETGGCGDHVPRPK